MKVIEMLSDRINEEVCDAKFYAMKAVEFKTTYPNLARTLNTIADQEYEHMNMLHNEVVRMIEEYRRENGEPPADMLAVYDYLHKKATEKAAEVKVIMQMYKS